MSNPKTKPEKLSAEISKVEINPDGTVTLQITHSRLPNRFRRGTSVGVEVALPAKVLWREE